MAFHDAAFLSVFFPLFFLLNRLLPSLRWKNRLLILASLAFYTLGQWQGLPILLLTALVSWAAGRFLAGHPGNRLVLAGALAAELLLLAGFKYLDFFAGVLGLPPVVSGLGLAAPLGISFFTFKAMSCVIDVFRGGTAAARFSDTLLYLSFFPQVISGPITRFGDFAPQLADRSVTPEHTARGLRRFILGMGKKLLIASLAAPVADAAFALGANLDMRTAWLGAAAYAIQLYFDFSGYSDMAVGLGAVFGFDTPENFRYPYIALSLQDFWRRWHISLSQWFRDYLYIPLGGGRRGRGRKAVNTAAVFLLCGLWHGAAWTFLLWGAWHALFSALESLGVIDCRRWARSGPGRALCRVYTLLVVCLGFVIFRAADPAQALAMFRGMFAGVRWTEASTLVLCRVSPASWLALLAGIAGSTPLAPRLSAWAAGLEGGAGTLVRFCAWVGTLALFLLCLMAAAGGSFQPFIYGQF